MAYGEDREGGLVALAAPGHGRKVGAVGLQQQAVVRDDGQGLAHGLVGRVADRSGDGDVPAVADDAPGHIGIAAKAVPEQRIADKTAGFESHEGLGLGVAAMDDHRLFQLAGQLQLIVQDLVLDLLGAVVPVEIEPDLAHGAETCDALGRGREVTFGERQLLAPVRVVVHRGGVQSHHRDALPRVAAAEVEQRPVAFGVYAREQQVLHARRRGAGQCLFAVGVERRIVQV